MPATAPYPRVVAKQPDQVLEQQVDIATLLKESRRPRRRTGRLAAFAVAALLAAGAAWYFLAAGGSGAAVTYTTQAVKRGDLTITVTATGTVQPTNEVEVSSELSGMIGSLAADYNDRVAKGQLLARLKTDQLQANVDLATATLAARKADVAQADATLSEKEHVYERSKTLLEKAFSSTEAFETAEADRNRAEAARDAAAANLDIADANLKIAQSNLAKAEIVSPIDGVVLARSVEVGQIVAASLSAPVLFTLAEDLTKMQLQVDVDEADMGLVKDGDPATFTVEAFSDRTFPATIAQLRLSPETVEGVVTYKAILTVDNSELLLRPGMTATADIRVKSVSDALLVPNAALRYTPPAAAETGGGGSGLLGLLIPPRPAGSAPAATVGANGQRSVYILKNGAPVAVPVTVGLSDGSFTEVTSGALAEGDVVIVASKTAS